MYQTKKGNASMNKNVNINYPSENWVENWVDKWLDKHPNEKVDDFNTIRAFAMDEWWDNEIDHGRPTPFDLTDEQKKVAKNVSKTTSGKGKTTAPKERKADEEKRSIIAELLKVAQMFDENAIVSNVEKTVDFVLNGNSYSLGLTKHRPKK